MPSIEIENMCKVVKEKTILKDITLSLRSGGVYGIVGINGSGKTYLFRTIAGLVKPTSGRLKVEADSIGIVIENDSLYPDFTGLQNLVFLAKIRNKIGIEEIKQTMREVGLDSQDKKKVKKYSLGMKQRLLIAQAVMEKPDILLLDEPTNALDAEGVSFVRNLIKREAKRGAIILLASHNETDIKELCEVVFIMSEGRLLRGDAH